MVKAEGTRHSGAESMGSHEARLAQVNGVLRTNGLAHPFMHVGDVNRNEIAVLGAREVLRLGRNTGLRLVELPVQFTPDKRDPSTSEVTPGNRGTFWTFFQTEEAAAQNQLVIPFVNDAPTGSQTPPDIPRSNPVVTDINRQLAELKLKALPYPIDEPRERVVGITDIVNVNKKYFTVVVFATVDQHGEQHERPIVYNAKSDSGMDGSVFAATVRSTDYGGEPRLIIGRSYRPTLGSITQEVPRGYYDQASELRVKWLTDSAIPPVRRALDEFMTETGVIDSRLLRLLTSLGPTMQDPTFEASTPHFYEIDITDPGWNPSSAIEVGEKYSAELLTHGEFFRSIPGIQDAFTLTAVARNLAKSNVLTVSTRGRSAQNSGERMVLGMPYRFQHGMHTTEAFRTSTDGMPVDENIGPIAVNTGNARIMPDVHIGTSSWRNIRQAGQNKDLPAPRLLYPQEALLAIEHGQLDVVTSAAIIKALHAKGYLEFDLGNLYR